jgi:thiol-disulfide isomerase/thioredoxin
MYWTRFIVCVALCFVGAWGCSRTTTNAPQSANGTRQSGTIRQVGASESPSEESTQIPEVSADAWLNCDGPQTLAGLRGNVVLIECWATWCMPCVQGIPHMNEMHARYSEKGLRILSFTNESLAKVQSFQKRARTAIEYPIGAGSSVSEQYGVRSIPHAILVGRDGQPIWQGHPANPKCEEMIVAALNVKTAAVDEEVAGVAEQ